MAVPIRLPRARSGFTTNHLLFADIASAGSANLRRDPRIDITCVDIFARRGYNFKGIAEMRSKGDSIYETIVASVQAEHADAMPIHNGVLVEVPVLKPILSPAYVPGAREAAHREAYGRKHGMAPLSALETAR